MDITIQSIRWKLNVESLFQPTIDFEDANVVSLPENSLVLNVHLEPSGWKPPYGCVGSTQVIILQ